MKNVLEKDIRARVQRNSVLVENTNGFIPTGKTANSCLYRHELQKRPSRNNFCISTSRVSLCWVKDRHPTGCLKWA